MGGCPVPNIPAFAILDNHLRRVLDCPLRALPCPALMAGAIIGFNTDIWLANLVNAGEQGLSVPLDLVDSGEQSLGFTLVD